LWSAASLQRRTIPQGGLQIVNPWARATPGGATVGAGYLTITNKGPDTDRLIGGSVAPASRIELHTMAMENGIAKMRPLSSVEIKPGATVEFTPGGMHMMFVGLKQPLKQGQTLKGTLVFEKAGTVPVEFTDPGRRRTGAGPRPSAPLDRVARHRRGAWRATKHSRKMDCRSDRAVRVTPDRGPDEPRYG
jgi:copper(I)-binding protein